MTSQDARFYGISSAASETFDNEDKPLVLQFSVKHQQQIDCGGGYIKILPEGLDQSEFSGDSEYYIMFGPDICGSSTRKVHAIFNYKGKNIEMSKTVKAVTDALTHVYTLIINPDQTYEIRVDGDVQASGNMEDDWPVLEPKMIDDPEDFKPADWVDESMIPDPEDVKPDDWDSIPETIPDPDATRPEDWDDDADGDWEVPMIPNPDYSGAWKPKMISNPEYKGEWKAKRIENPDYEADPSFHVFRNMKFVGFELWQVKSGSIFDNIIVTDSVEEAEALMKETFDDLKDEEKKAYDAFQEEKAKKAEEARKAAEDMEFEDDEFEEDEEHDEL
jgi:calreticulin